MRHELSQPSDQPPTGVTPISGPSDIPPIAAPAEDFGHVPVLPEDVAGFCPPLSAGLIVDCTLGAGGHSALLLERTSPSVTLIGLDADPSAIVTAGKRLAGFGARATLVNRNFGGLADELDARGLKADFILADIGLSSRQLADESRGFSFSAGGRLDMRFDPSGALTAEEIVNKWPEEKLADLIFQAGEDPFARRIARKIIEIRRQRRLSTAGDLADVIRGAYPAPVRRKSRIDPATRTFQALRIAVNDELGQLDRLLAAGPPRLKVGGRMAVISFHSLEDRRVKQAFRDAAAGKSAAGRFALLTKKPVVAGPRETAGNPRSRSAKLRVIERIE